MGVPLLVLLISVVCAMPARAQASNDTWEIGLGPHVARRDDSTVHNGGGITIARQFQTAADELERFFHPRADNPVQKGARDMVRIVRLFFADQRYIDEFALVGR